MKSGKMKVKLYKKENISKKLIDEMWQLYQQNYDYVTKTEFLDDLKEKNMIFIGKDKGKFAGFSAMKIYKTKINNKVHGVLYPGDTMIKKEYWGQKGLHNRFFIECLKFKLKNPFTPFYFFIICMGHKTYLITTKNFPHYWPRYDQKTPLDKLEVLNTIAHDKFKNFYNPKTHIIDIKSTRCRLGDHVSPITDEVLKIPEVKFLVESNPTYKDGTELATIAKVDLKFFGVMIYKSTLGLLVKRIKKKISMNQKRAFGVINA